MSPMSNKETLSPSQKTGISNGQIDKLQEMLKHGLKKSDLLATSSTAQIDQAIKTYGGNLRDEFVQSLERKLQEMIAEAENTFTVIAKRVDYTRTPAEVIHATGRAEYVDWNVAATMPRRCQGVVENVEVVFFRTGRQLTAEEQEQACAERNLDTDPYAQGAVNEQDAAFADKYPNGSQWDRDGKVASYLAFNRWSDDERGVSCSRSGGDWSGSWLCSGVRKVSAPKAQ